MGAGAEGEFWHLRKLLASGGPQAYDCASLFGLFRAGQGFPPPKPLLGLTFSIAGGARARPPSPGNAQPQLPPSGKLEPKKPGPMGKGSRNGGWDSGPVWVVPSSFKQALLIYAKHMQITQKRDTTSPGMSGETLEIIQPTPPHFTGEERVPGGKGLAQGHTDTWVLRKDQN